jgi:hypothetical protein
MHADFFLSLTMLFWSEGYRDPIIKIDPEKAGSVKRIPRE